MPVAKTPFLRYRIINQCLTNKYKPFPTLDEIQTELAKHDIEVHIRQIERDFDSMRHDERLGYYAPIEYCRKNRGYHYNDTNYSINMLPLTPAEMEAFEVSLAALKCFKGAAILRQVEGMFDKLDKLVVQYKTKRTEFDYPIVDFEKMPYAKGIEHFDAIYQAILKKHPLAIAYRKFNLASAEHVFHPYLIKEYKFRWYVLGYSEKRRCKLILALDRI